ncbi:MAG: hypothetical protein ACKORB_07470 [Opitutia bacterium]|jgi:hypothetical protein
MRDGEQPQGDHDGSGNAPWNESDWTGYLRRNELEIGRFLSHYHEVRKLPDRLDQSARSMGWENADWAPPEGLVEDAPEEAEDHEPPYCIHQHPVYVVSRALGIELMDTFRSLCDKAGHAITPRQAADIAHSFWESQHEMIMAVNATDTGDPALALVHMKRALSAINHAMGLVANIAPAARMSAADEADTLEGALFDLREVCLRVMADCRWENPGR